MKTNLLYESLPNDTRSIELISGIALLAVGFGMLVNIVELPAFMQDIHTESFWWRLFACLGIVQWVSVVYAKTTPVLRVACCLVIGCAWSWFGASVVTDTSNVSGMLALCLGIGNLYSYIINKTLLFIKKN